MKSSYYLIFAAIFLASMVFYNWFKQNNLRKEFKKFDKNDILMYTYGVYYYGVESEKGKILNSQGLYDST